MMAKKLQRSVVGTPTTAKTYPVGKTVATTGGKTKKVTKVKKVQIPGKNLNKPTFPKTTKK